MAERKINTVTTPSGIPVEMKEYISAGEFLDATDSKDGELSKNELAKRVLQLAVVSVNGDVTNIPAALRDLPLGDYLFISKEVAKLTNADFTEAKSQ